MRNAAACLACLLVLGTVACNSRPKPEKTEKPRGVRQFDPVPAAPGPAPSDEAEPLPKLDTSAQAAVAEQKEQAPAEAKKRDFAAELTAQLGSAVSCLAPRAADSTLRGVDIGIVANITPSGRVSRAEISAGLSSDELACLRQRVESASLAPPFDEAPFRVSASLRFELAPPPKAPVVAPTPTVEAAAVGTPPTTEAPQNPPEGSYGTTAPPAEAPPEEPPTP